MIIDCGCPTPDGKVCIAVRYGREIEDVDEPCQCCCHDDNDDEEV